MFHVLDLLLSGLFEHGFEDIFEQGEVRIRLRLAVRPADLSSSVTYCAGSPSQSTADQLSGRCCCAL
eukprot:g82771.t1